MNKRVIEINGIGVALISRAGSTSIYWTCKETEHQYYERHLPNIPTYAFIRDPLERHISGARALPGKYKSTKQTTYQEYTDRVLSGEEDNHWSPQHKILEGIKDLRPFPFERMNHVWTMELMPQGFPQLKHENKSPYTIGRQCVLDLRYRLDELLKFYKEDFELRHGDDR